MRQGIAVSNRLFVDAAIAYAVEQGWLIVAGNPAHSIASMTRGVL